MKGELLSAAAAAWKMKREREKGKLLLIKSPSAFSHTFSLFLFLFLLYSCLYNRTRNLTLTYQLLSSPLSLYKILLKSVLGIIKNKTEILSLTASFYSRLSCRCPFVNYDIIHEF
jgi:hypothetical protein